MAPPAASVEEAADRFARLFVTTFATAVLTRVFLVLPYGLIPAEERMFAASLCPDPGLLTDETPTLMLLGTAGHEEEWGDRKRSQGHRAIPLLSHAFIQGIPMLARLVTDLGFNVAGVPSARGISSRPMLGGNNGTFYVPDASTAVDDEGRLIISARDFVSHHQVRTVFGMGGAYVNGVLAITIVFTNEVLERAVVDRYPSFISNFKMSTSTLLQKGSIFRDASK